MLDGAGENNTKRRKKSTSQQIFPRNIKKHGSNIPRHVYDSDTITRFEFYLVTEKILSFSFFFFFFSTRKNSVKPSHHYLNFPCGCIVVYSLITRHNIKKPKSFSHSPTKRKREREIYTYARTTSKLLPQSLFLCLDSCMIISRRLRFFFFLIDDP